jgi:hypothetical protein
MYCHIKTDEVGRESQRFLAVLNSIGNPIVLYPHFGSTANSDLTTPSPLLCLERASSADGSTVA